MAEAMPKPGVWTRVVYGVGSVAFGTKDAGFNTFLLIYYNQVLGVRASLVSLAAAIALVVDALTDPLIGEISDNWRSRLGRRHPFMYSAALPIAVFYFLLWNPPHWKPENLFFYLLAMAILVRICISLYEVPSTALTAELSPDYTERTTLLSFRWLFGAFGAGITIAVALSRFMVPTKTQPAGILNPHGYFNYSIMAAAIMFASITISAVGTHNRIRYLHQLPTKRQASLAALAREVVHSLSNGSFVSVTVSAIFGGVAGGLVTALGTYINIYFWKFTPQQLAFLGAAAALATILAVVLAPPVTAIFGKKRGYMVTAVGSLIVNNITITLKLFGLLPVSNANLLLGILFVTTTIGLALAICCLILVGSMITDVVEDSQLKTGRRSEGLFSAAIAFVAKSTSGFGILLSGLLIDFVHFPKHASPATIDPSVMRQLLFVYMPLQLTLFAISIACLLPYRISHASHEANLARLAGAAAAAETMRTGIEPETTELTVADAESQIRVAAARDH
jgi:Na+/melibiose symporter-like transporter